MRFVLKKCGNSTQKKEQIDSALQEWIQFVSCGSSRAELPYKDI